MRNETFSLDDLNELSEGFGDRILTLLNGHRDWFGCQQSEAEITRLLNKNDLTKSDILVNRGLAEGLTIDVAFKNAAAHYQFQDQFDA